MSEEVARSDWIESMLLLEIKVGMVKCCSTTWKKERESRGGFGLRLFFGPDSMTILRTWPAPHLQHLVRKWSEMLVSALGTHRPLL